MECDNVSAFYFLDNSKRENRMDINKEFAQMFDKFMSISQPHMDGTIDPEEVGLLACEKGATVFYMLSNGETNFDRGWEEAQKQSIFADFENLYGDDCTKLGISVIENGYNREEIEDRFEVDDVYKGYNSKFNMVVLSGNTPPKYAIEVLEESLSESKKHASKKVDTRDLIIKNNATEKPKEIIKLEAKASSDNLYSTDEIDALLDDDDFWDSI